MSNEELEAIYTKDRRWEKVREFCSEYSKLQKHPQLSTPFLCTWPPAYGKSATRLFVVGQQTNAWKWQGITAESQPRDIMEKQADFLRLYPKYRGAFWSAVRYLQDHLGLESGNLMWSNLVKVDQCASGARRGVAAAREVRSWFSKHFNVLPEELKVADPTMVVFFACPHYEEDLRRLMSGVTLEPVPGCGAFLKTVGNLPVNHPERVAAFYTYHPAYLRRKGQYRPVLDKMLEMYRVRTG